MRLDSDSINCAGIVEKLHVSLCPSQCIGRGELESF